MKKHGKTVLKIIISLLGLYIALRGIPLNDVWNKMVTADPIWLLIAFLLILSSLVIRTKRWSVLLDGLKTAVPFPRLLQLYFIGQFFNAFLPSGVGGDVVRAVAAGKDAPKEIAAGTVLIDRMSGLLTLFMFALVALPFAPDNMDPKTQTLFLGFALIGLVGGFLLLQGSLLRFIGNFLEQASQSSSYIQTIYQKVWPIFASIEACGTKAIAKAFGISVIFNLIQVSWWIIIGHSLKIDLSPVYYFLIVPILSATLLVPSIGGAGVREATAKILFSSFGVGEELAVALSVLELVLQRITSLMGLPVYLYSLRK